MLNVFKLMRLSKISKYILIIISIVFIAIILYLWMLYLKEQGEKNHNDYLVNVKQTHDKFRKKIENIEILLNIIGSVIIENNYYKPEEIYSVFSQYIDYYEKHLNIASKDENPLLIQFLNKDADVKVDRFSGITKCNGTKACINLIEIAHKNSWKVHFDNIKQELLKNDYISSLVFGLVDKNEKYFGVLLVHLNKENISNFIDYSGLITVLDKECNFIFSNKSNDAYSAKYNRFMSFCKSVNNNKNIQDVNWQKRKNMSTLYHINYKDLIFIFEPNEHKDPHSLDRFYSVITNEVYISMIVILIVLFFTILLLFLLHLKIRKQEEQFDSYVDNKSYNKINFSHVLERVKNLNQSIEIDKEKTDELELISELIPVITHNINDNLSGILSFIDKYEKTYLDGANKKSNNAIDYFKRQFKFWSHRHFTLTKSRIVLNKFLNNVLNEYGFSFSLSKFDNGNFSIYGDKNLIKTMVFELLTKFYEYKQPNNVNISIKKDSGMKKIIITMEGKLDLEEIHKKIIKIDFPKSTVINELLFITKGLLYAKFIMKIHNGSLKIKKNDEIITVKLFFDEI
ncbi:hypothetical protein N3Z17_00215 [Candidatus Bandiella numerosa]|uniref:hypothetical protein n=1 Tax=Candidatus Bandiella numerosa TaxID=2570586 RepID=UPI00249DD5E3|nr:hypothetical protein [Candidatus Bandiella numerosa]WHA04978.1 hypothetical protein N3Z17_00215 [Candidatus Bandiella numerosa]